MMTTTFMGFQRVARATSVPVTLRAPLLDQRSLWDNPTRSRNVDDREAANGLQGLPLAIALSAGIWVAIGGLVSYAMGGLG